MHPLQQALQRDRTSLPWAGRRIWRSLCGLPRAEPSDFMHVLWQGPTSAALSGLELRSFGEAVLAASVPHHLDRADFNPLGFLVAEACALFLYKHACLLVRWDADATFSNVDLAGLSLVVNSISEGRSRSGVGSQRRSEQGCLLH